ncbi:fimbrial biogenesis chaperone [Herbaspirillum rhizosphaerae]|uniref:fimbrial biogenesis chaperone n=1 Tax=Herbaspirillum rhizosphaerae TaxID=346179 RepID=UPI00067D8C9C|nr:fimbria/pilus periplasmic chaperone [Herbaspirillum rhizosphaerae]
MNHKLKIILTLCALCIGATGQADASVVINNTRVVFPSNEREVSIRMTNEGLSPGLVQMWLDKGDVKSVPNEIQVPFLLTPPLFRIDPAKGQTVRMILNPTEKLPQDKESLFWLNMLEVPPRPQNIDTNDTSYMQMAFRTRIKVFYRPQALNTQEQLLTAPGRLTWKLVRNGDAYALEARNPTPYYLNLTKAGLGVPKAEKPEAMNEEGGMLPPGGEARFELKDLHKAPAAGVKVRFTYLNDYGGGVDVESDFTQ